MRNARSQGRAPRAAGWNRRAGKPQTVCRLACALAITVLLGQAAQAATALSAIRYIPDITVSLAGVTVGPTDVAIDTLSGAPTLALTGLPANVAAYRYAGSGIHWLAFETTVLLPGGLTATPQDVISYDGTAYAKIFDGAAHGVPAGVAIDALSTTDGTDFLLSFDTTAMVGGVTAAPADVVRYSGGWTSYFVGAAAGVPAGVNLDALYYLPSNGHLLASFDIAGTVAGVNFSAGDVLEFTAPANWQLAFSPSALYAGWGAANLRGLWAQAAPTGAPGTLQFSAPAYSVNENGVTAAITVTRTGGNTGTVAVTYATSDGTATAPADYAATSGTLNWADGDMTPKTFSIAIVNDALIEGNETVQLTLASPSGGASLGTASATLTIVDDDLPANTPLVIANPLAFGSQTVATSSATQVVTLTNNGSANLTIAAGGVTLTGTNAGDFAISANSCSGSTVAPAATCTVTLRFTPTAVGARGASLAVASNAAPLAVGLSGTGTAAAVAGSDIANVPTLSEWGLILLSLLLAVFSAPKFLRKETL